MSDDSFYEEGQRSVFRENEALPESGGEEKIDLRKMIIYSELLKPKFDE